MKTRQPYVTLAIDNPDPRPNLYECAAEQLQSVESDEGQARMWGMLWAVYFAGVLSGLAALVVGLFLVEALR